LGVVAGDLTITRARMRTALLAAAAATAAAAPAAQAEYGPGAVPASERGNELGEAGSFAPALSADGRYVVFRTSSAVLLGEPASPEQFHTLGLVRKDLVSGELQHVAPAERASRADGQPVDGSPDLSGELSISANGRFVLFTTTDQLAPGDTNAVADVYVRDMTRPLGDTSGDPAFAAYELVSAVDGAVRAPAYIDPTIGSEAGARRAALSDDGRTAVFVAHGRTTLPTGDIRHGITPPDQVFVRSLDARTTRLVTRDRQDPGMPGTPVPPDRSPGPAPAAPDPQLSGDGTTVAWTATNATRMARFLNGEAADRQHLLWRDMSAGPAAPARRVTGVADPDDGACPPGFTYVESQTATGPCYGPLATGEAMDLGGSNPAAHPFALSDDGRRVALITLATLRPFENAAASRPGALYVVDMSPGVSRKAGTVRVASVPRAAFDVGNALGGTALSGDGRYAAFISREVAFQGPRPVGSFPTGPLDTHNAYMIDLAQGTVERITRAASGGDFSGPPRAADGTTIDPALNNLSVADGGSAVAFNAGDGNLFRGDGNGATDVQVVRRTEDLGGSGSGRAPGAPPGAPPPDLSEPRLFPLPAIHPLIGDVRLTRSGVARVTVRVPAAGRLNAVASGRRGRRGRGRAVPVGKDAERVRRAMTVTLRVRPSKAAKRALRRRPHRLAVRMRIRYRPRLGRSTTATRSYRLGRRAAR
jgi:hypothetical protein